MLGYSAGSFFVLQDAVACAWIHRIHGMNANSARYGSDAQSRVQSDLTIPRLPVLFGVHHMELGTVHAPLPHANGA